MSVFRLLVRVSQHLWRQVPLSALPGGESLASALSCHKAVYTFMLQSRLVALDHFIGETHPIGHRLIIPENI